MPVWKESLFGLYNIFQKCLDLGQYIVSSALIHKIWMMKMGNCVAAVVILLVYGCSRMLYI